MRNLTIYKIQEDLEEIIDMEGYAGLSKDIVLSYFNQQNNLSPEDIEGIHSILRKTDL